LEKLATEAITPKKGKPDEEVRVGEATAITGDVTVNNLVVGQGVTAEGLG
jgi:hypothetical protein